MFIGEYQHQLDEKGRIAIPSKFRQELSIGAVITKGLDGCLSLYPRQEWEKLATKLSALPFGKANTRAFSRYMLAAAMDVTLDTQGRVVIPEYLRRYGNLVGPAVIAGLGSRLEIWDEQRWMEYKKDTEKASEEIAEQLNEF